MIRNNLFIAPFFLSGHCPIVGGQAVIEGVMMRYDDVYSVAVRTQDKTIVASRFRWYSIMGRSWLKLPFFRGFPILLESLVNGVQALNHSISMAESRRPPANRDLVGMAASVLAAVFLAIFLFIALPHFLSLLMAWSGLGADVEGLSFHLWDGFFKCVIFIDYLWLISFIPDIRRVFSYHGAEHKIIRAYEEEDDVDAANAGCKTRLHPRCGTTFMLFVIVVSIIIQSILLPFLMIPLTTAPLLLRHGLAILWKLVLIIPVSAIAYELIRFAASLPEGLVSIILQGPGLLLQKMTTSEPDAHQLEVALVALAVALGSDQGDRVHTPAYYRLSHTED